MSTAAAPIPNVSMAGEAILDFVATAVEKALRDNLGDGAAALSFKVTNITVDAGKVLRDHMAVEVRKKKPQKR